MARSEGQEEEADEEKVDYGDDDDDDYNTLHDSEFIDPEHIDIPNFEQDMARSSTPQVNSNPGWSPISQELHLTRIYLQ